MVNKTSIEWVAKYNQQGELIEQGYTSNPIYAINKDTGKRGWFCSKCAPECAHCYSEALNLRWGNGLTYTETNLDKIEWVLSEKEIDELLKLKGEHTIFLGDMTDIFHPTIPINYKLAIFRTTGMIRHRVMILTKRVLEAKEFFSIYPDFAELPNLWLGATVGNTHLDKIDILKQIPVIHRFLSIEPLLAPIPTLHKYLDQISQVIVGAESGRGARPMQEQWVRDIKDQCVAAGVAFFYKQNALKGKKISLPILDGQQWLGMPEVCNG